MRFSIDSELPALRAYSRALCTDRADAEALLARSLGTAAARAADYDPAIRLRVWLLWVMRRTHFERERLCAPDGAAKGAPPEPRATAENGTEEDAGDPGQAMERVLSDLPVDLREVLTLLFVLGLTHEEVAMVIDSSAAEVILRAGRAATLLRMGLAELRRRMRVHVL